jgi:hypothetical protein
LAVDGDDLELDVVDVVVVDVAVLVVIAHARRAVAV